MLILHLSWIQLNFDLTKRNLLIGSLTIAFFAFSFVYTLVETAQTDSPEESARYFLSNESHYLQPIPRTYLTITQGIIDGEPISSSTWFSGYYRSTRERLAAFLIDPNQYFEIFPEIVVSDAALDQFKNDQNSILVGERTMTQHDWDVGDNLTLGSSSYLNSSQGPNWQFRIAGTFSSESVRGDKSSIYMHYEYVNNLTIGWKDTVGLLIIRLNQTQIDEGVLVEIEEVFSTRSPSLSTLSESSLSMAFIAQLEEFGTIALWLFVATFGVTFIVYNSAQFLSNQQMLTDSKLLYYLGFTKKSLILISFMVNLALVFISVFLGTILGQFGLVIFAEYFPLPSLIVSFSTILISSAIALSFCVLSTLISGGLSLRYIK